MDFCFAIWNVCKFWPRQICDFFWQNYVLIFRGVKAVDKKEGSGSHNWGTFEDEMKAEEDKANTSTDMNDSNVETENANDANVPNEAEEARRAAEEEEAKTMTLGSDLWIDNILKVFWNWF